jgi:flagellar assembly protein FliH
VSGRLNLPGASVLPFQFPALRDEEEAPVPPPPSPAVVSVPLPAAPEPAVAVEAVAAELARAHEEGLQSGIAEGREAGYVAGFAEGAKAGEATTIEVAQRLAAVVDKLGLPTAALEQPVEEAVVALALEVARCVIGDGVKRSHEFLAALVREAIAKVPIDMGAPHVLLNPADLELVRRLAPEIDDGNAMLVADDTIEPGGALIVADGEERQAKDRRWNPRTAEGVSEVNLTLSSRWRAAMLALFDGGDE